MSTVAEVVAAYRAITPRSPHGHPPAQIMEPTVHINGETVDVHGEVPLDDFDARPPGSCEAGMLRHLLSDLGAGQLVPAGKIRREWGIDPAREVIWFRWTCPVEPIGAPIENFGMGLYG